MAHHEGFLQDIIGHPAEDAPRLIYADWLEEHGQAERGEFIRVQCALVAPPWRVGRVYDDPAWLRLYGRERELLNDAVHWWDWLADFYRITGQSAIGDLDHSSDPPTLAVRFRRGFVAEVTLPCDQWMRHGPALVRAAPLEKVKLSDKWPGDGEEGGWGWAVEDSDEAPPWRLPDCLATRLDPRLPRWVYPSPEAAQDALSRACLKWARSPAPVVH
jgi:uncharacterized protein (TIGR02996 family)